ncbi:hypothetical protein [Pleurocapsa sp. PCC 7319]|uniref:hypothetical protein n=1 Tax=Pleurocapsa sp. PCC 7319 TaxID=118161 RepID=UPI001181BD80|nr:hypothetical protein [Pleurocapsa sp. PCC 7319]
MTNSVSGDGSKTFSHLTSQHSSPKMLSLEGVISTLSVETRLTFLKLLPEKDTLYVIQNDI